MNFPFQSRKNPQRPNINFIESLREESGFTLGELIIVVVVLIILSTFLLPRLTPSSEESNQETSFIFKTLQADKG